MYEISANNRRSYESSNARSAASVAVAWAHQGHAPKAFATRDGEGPAAVKIIEVPITSVAGTARALAAAK
jgi:hypothetical protein